VDETQLRRRSELLPDEETGLGATLKRHATHAEARSSAPDVTLEADGGSLSSKKKRLRSLSETLSNIWAKDKEQRKGKRRDDGGDGANAS
jgi:hypothetical protein